MTQSNQQSSATEDDGPSIEDRITHCLKIYPILSHSMLQTGIGTNISPIDWKPVLQEMIHKGKVIRDELQVKSVSGRDFCYNRIYLKK